MPELVGKAEELLVSKLVGDKANPLYTTFAKIYTASPRENAWIDTDSWGIAAVIIDRSFGVSRRIGIYDTETWKPIFVQELYYDMIYIEQTPRFHSFEADGVQVGLSFLTEDSAKNFSAKVQSMIPVQDAKPRPAAPGTRKEGLTKQIDKASAAISSLVSSVLPETTGGLSRSSSRTSIAKMSTPGEDDGTANVSDEPAEAPFFKRFTSISADTFKNVSSYISDKSSSIFGSEAAPVVAEIGLPYGFKHDTHIGYDPEKGFDTTDLNNLSPEWKSLFKSAGIRKKDLTNPETAKAIKEVFQNFEETGEVSAESMLEVLNNTTGTSSTSMSQPVMVNNDNKTANTNADTNTNTNTTPIDNGATITTGNSVRALPASLQQQLRKQQNLLQEQQQKKLSTHFVERNSQPPPVPKTATNTTAPPSAPPLAPPMAPPLAPSMRPNTISAGTPPPPAPAASKPRPNVSSQRRMSVLDEIKKGRVLRKSVSAPAGGKAALPDLSKYSKSENDTLIHTLRSAMAKRLDAIGDGSDDDDEVDDWSE